MCNTMLHISLQWDVQHYASHLLALTRPRVDGNAAVATAAKGGKGGSSLSKPWLCSRALIVLLSSSSVEVAQRGHASLANSRNRSLL